MRGTPPCPLTQDAAASVIQGFRKSVDDFVWGKALDRYGRAGRLFAVMMRYVYAIGRDVIYGQLTLRSMSLVYTTLLSIVPLMAFSFSVLKGFGVHEQLEPLLFKVLEPLGEQGERITERVMELVDNVKGSVLGGISFAFFIYTAISMVQKVEESFNYVWYVSKPRSFARRFSDYVLVLLIGPVAIFIAIGILASITNNTATRWLLENAAIGPLVVELGKLTPYLLVSAVFTFLYKIIPNTRVRLAAALVGGLAGGIMWASMGIIFTTFVQYAARIQLIYSGFAVAITTLMWLYLNWLVLLIGAQIAFYIQKPAFLRIGRREPKLSNATRERLALNIMYFVGKAFRDPSRKATLADIGQQLNIPTIALAPVANELEAAGLLRTTEEEEELLPGREMTRISVHDILDVVRAGGVTGSYRDPSWSRSVDELGARIESAVADVVGEQSLAGLLDAATSGDA